MFMTISLLGPGRAPGMIKDALYNVLSTAYIAAYYAAFHAVALGDALYCFAQVPRQFRTSCTEGVSIILQR